MAEEMPSLHIDTDWKKQAQEEKRRLAEQSAKAKETIIAPAAASVASVAPQPGARTAARDRSQTPQATFASLIQTVWTQALYYLGELQMRSAEPNLDLAKLQIDTLAMLEEKTRNNLSSDEQRALDTALYETRMRFVNVASQML